MNDKIEELQSYADLDGTEMGEKCDHLIALMQISPYLSAEFKVALMKEIDEDLGTYKNGFYITETTETQQYTHKTLETKL